MNHILTFLIVFFLFSCNISTQKEKNNSETNLIIKKKSVDFDFDKFKILKGQLGEIKIGMTISEAEIQFSGLTKKMDEAISFGFGGGSPAYLYYLGNDLLFGLIPKLDTDTLLFIVAAHKNLKTINGLNPNSTVEELLKTYPKMTVQKDLMNGWEFFKDDKNALDFVFMTDEQTEIGEYPELDVPSKPKRIKTKTDWITIR